MFILSLLLSLTSLSTTAFAERHILGISTSLGEESNCYSDSYENTQWKYCITETRDSRSLDVLYEFHGLGGNEKDWLDKERNIGIRKYWKNNAIEAPTVVSVSFGPVWIMAEENPSSFSGLYEMVTQHVMVNIEQKLKSLTGRRILMGASMGGFNASQIYLKNPEMFDKFVLACPIMANISLYASNDEIQQYQKENNASWAKVLTMFGIGRQYFPDEASFERAWAIKLVPTHVSVNSPPVHVSCGKADEYGIHNSVKAFAQAVADQGATVTWQSVNGGHCATNPSSIAKFIAE